MQSDAPVPAAEADESLRPTLSGEQAEGARRLVIFGLLPVAGLLAELTTGALNSHVTLFPSAGWLLAVVAAVVANAALHAPGLAARLPLTLSIAMHAFAFGMTVFYAVVMAPALPFMLILALLGLGVLAAAPYWALAGMPGLLRRLRRRCRDEEVSPTALATCLVAAVVAPFGVTLSDGFERSEVGERMVALAAAIAVDDGAEQERLAASLRLDDLELQRTISETGRIGVVDDFGPLGTDGGGSGSCRQFWFARRLLSFEMPERDARAAFFRAHGRYHDDVALVDPSRLSGLNLEWRESRYEVSLEPDAAVARVDWLATVHSTSPMIREARFELRLPQHAVASSLSLWIDGEERPAAFAGGSVVRAAYDKVVAKRRDPALLEEVSPGRLQLLLFPVSRGLPPMRVRVGVTVPLRTDGDRALLSLPTVASHNCFGYAVTKSELAIDGRAERTLDGAAADEEISVPFAPTTTFARDADGFVVQSFARADAVAAADRRYVVVLDGSAGVAAALPEPTALLDELPEGAPCTVLVARGTSFVRVDGEAGSPALREALRAVPFEGGCDAAPALRRAVEVARASGTGVVHWVCGPMALRLVDGTVTTGDVRLAVLPVAPATNVRREDPALRGAVDEVWVASFSPPALRGAFRGALAPPAHGEIGLQVGDTKRVFERRAAPPDDAREVGDQLARLWAAWAARREPDAAVAARLAARFRVVTAGAGAVVLETQQQYEDAGLDPGAALGREPDGDIGSRPVPEPSTFVLFGVGLLVLLFVVRRRRVVAPRPHP